MEARFDTDTIRLMSFFEETTGTSVKDCVVDGDSVYLVVDEGKAGAAIGKGGANVKNAEKTIGKSIKVFEFSNDCVAFVKNMVPKATEVTMKKDGERSVVEIKVGKADMAMVIGRDGRNIRLFKELLQRNHHIDDLVVRDK